MATSLEFIKSVNTTKNVSSLSLTDVFSSKYDHYQVHLNVDDVDSEVAIEFRMMNSGGAVESSNYDHCHIFMVSGSGSTSEGSYEGATKWQYCMYGEYNAGGFVVMNVFNPANSAKWTMMEYRTATHYYASSTATHLGRTGYGVLRVAEAHTGIQVYAGSAIITEAKLSVFGVKG